jgi:hypothetical protein
MGYKCRDCGYLKLVVTTYWCVLYKVWVLIGNIDLERGCECFATPDQVDEDKISRKDW